MTHLASLFAVFMLYFAIYLRDSTAQFFPNSVFLLALAIGVLLLAVQSANKLTRNNLAFLFTTFFLLVINSASQTGIQFSNYLLAPAIALFIAKCAPRIFTRLLIFHLIASVLVQVYEHTSGHFLFVTVAEDGSRLTSEFFAGAAGVFRAKGLFQGPLSAVAFYILMVYLIPGIIVPLLAFIGSLLAYGRLGILVSSTMILNQVFAASGSRARIIILAAIPFAGMALLSTYLQDTFFLSAFDLNSSGNLARIYYWTTSLEAYWSYDFLNLVFGNLNYANRAGIYPESDFLRLLLDCGALGLVFYIIALMYFYKLLSREREMSFLLFATLIFCMSVFPFLQSLNTAVLFWFIFWTKNEEHRHSLIARY